MVLVIEKLSISDHVMALLGNEILPDVARQLFTFTVSCVVCLKQNNYLNYCFRKPETQFVRRVRI